MRRFNRLTRQRFAIAAMTLAVPTVASAAAPPTAPTKEVPEKAVVKAEAPESQAAPIRPSPLALVAPDKQAGLRSLFDVLPGLERVEASPFEPPGRPPGRPPSPPGHDNPPNPPGQPPGRPPNNSG